MNAPAQTSPKSIGNVVLSSTTLEDDPSDPFCLLTHTNYVVRPLVAFLRPLAWEKGYKQLLLVVVFRLAIHFMLVDSLECLRLGTPE